MFRICPDSFSVLSQLSWSNSCNQSAKYSGRMLKSANRKTTLPCNRCFFESENVQKCVFSRVSIPHPAGGAYSAPQTHYRVKGRRKGRTGGKWEGWGERRESLCRISRNTVKYALWQITCQLPLRRSPDVVQCRRRQLHSWRNVM